MKYIYPIDIHEYTSISYLRRKNSTSRIIYWIVLFALLLVIISFFLIYVDITSQSRGVIQTPLENNNIQSLISGQIIKTKLEENKYVLKGDTLVWLRIDDLLDKKSKIKNQIIDNQSFINDINHLFIGEKPLTAKYNRENEEYLSEILKQNISLEQAQKEYEISKILYDKGIDSKYDFDKIENAYKNQRAQLNALRINKYSSWESERTKLELEYNDLRSELQQVINSEYQYFIISPISGYIIQYTGVKESNFISSNQTLAQIVPEDNLIVESFVSPSDIGYIHIGQDVKFQIDAFNYQQWGLVNGIVTDIIPDVIQINENPYFRVRCSLEKESIELENGYQGKLKKGMTLTARFFLNRRSIFQLFFDNINDWLNPNIIKK